MTQDNANEITLTRDYSAPLISVWDAFTDAAQASQWWGPRGFSITTHAKDLRPGGIWHYTMHGPDGVDYPNKTRYHEVVEHARLVYDHGGNDEQKPMFRVTVVFTAVDGGTRMDMTMRFPSPEALEAARAIIKKAGGESTWDRLAEYLEKQRSGKETFVLNRSFAAPLEQVFEAWTDPKRLAQWSPPVGFSMEFIRADIRPGGGTFSVMTDGKGAAMYGRAAYLIIEKPNRIAYTQQFCDQEERVSRHPLSPTWPATMLTEIQLAAEGPDQTRVTLTWTPYGTVDATELATFVNARGGMTQGWTGSLHKLETYLAR